MGGRRIKGGLTAGAIGALLLGLGGLGGAAWATMTHAGMTDPGVTDKRPMPRLSRTTNDAKVAAEAREEGRSRSRGGYYIYTGSGRSGSYRGGGRGYSGGGWGGGK